MTIDQIMRLAPVIPVLVLEGDEDWAKLAQTFVNAGLPVLEVTLRTRGALRAIKQMRSVDGAIVGAGTVLDRGQLDQSLDAGAQFIVSPGLTEPLANAVKDSESLSSRRCNRWQHDARDRSWARSLQILSGRGIRGDCGLKIALRARLDRSAFVRPGWKSEAKPPVSGSDLRPFYVLGDPGFTRRETSSIVLQNRSRAASSLGAFLNFLLTILP